MLGLARDAFYAATFGDHQPVHSSGLENLSHGQQRVAKKWSCLWRQWSLGGFISTEPFLTGRGGVSGSLPAFMEADLNGCAARTRPRT